MSLFRRGVDVAVASYEDVEDSVLLNRCIMLDVESDGCLKEWWWSGSASGVSIKEQCTKHSAGVQR